MKDLAAVDPLINSLRTGEKRFGDAHLPRVADVALNRLERRKRKRCSDKECDANADIRQQRRCSPPTNVS